MADTLMQRQEYRRQMVALYEALDGMKLQGRPNWVDLSQDGYFVELVIAEEVYGEWRFDDGLFILRRIRDNGDWRQAKTLAQAVEVSKAFLAPFLDDSHSGPTR